MLNEEELIYFGKSLFLLIGAGFYFLSLYSLLVEIVSNVTNYSVLDFNLLFNKLGLCFSLKHFLLGVISFVFIKLILLF